MTSGPSPSTAQWRLTPLVATVRCSRAIAGRHSEGAAALSNRSAGLSLPRARRIMIAMAPRDRFLLCTPRFYRVEYVINPWMEGNVGRTDAEEAMRQWEALRAALAARAHLELLEPAAGLPDMPFTANAGLVHEDTFVPARFRFPQRAPETRHAVEWFRRRGHRIAELPGRGTFEGEGDALFQPGAPLLWGGYGVRTSLQADRHLAEMLDVEVVPLRLVDERFYHLDTCFCPLPEGRVFYYPDAFDRESLERIAARVPAEQRFEVDAADALHFACNAVVTGGAVITNFASDALRERLVRWGHEVVVCPLGQFILAGGARVADEERDARLEPVEQDGVAPHDFYGTSIFPTDVRVRGRWVRAARQRMDAVLVVDGAPGEPHVTCRLIRELGRGDLVVCGVDGVRTEPTHVPRTGETFGFMTADASSERRVELAVERIAWEMRRLRERGGKMVVVASPVVIHTGGSPHLARLVHRGYVQALLGGNGLAAHDVEQALFGTSLGVDLKRGINVQGGHRNHLAAINLVRAHGGIRQAVEAGAVRSGVMYECVRHGVPFALAGSIRDDGPLPDTIVDLVAAQAEYARLIEGADMILMLSSMLHSIGVGNMTPAGVRLICVDISPAVVTKLADRGSVESTGIVTDVGLFLNLLDAALRS